MGQRVIQLKHSDLAGTGMLTFTDASPRSTGGNVIFVLAADMNGDGARDIIGVNADPAVHGNAGGQGSLAILINQEGQVPCPGDVNGDRVVSFADLVAVLSAWGPCKGCPADIDGSGEVTFSDLLEVLSGWGACPVAE